jgi:hypothetical protein
MEEARAEKEYRGVSAGSLEEPGGSMEALMEEEATWLRARVIRLRAALRFSKDARTEVILREVISDAEDRLAALDHVHRTAANANSS